MKKQLTLLMAMILVLCATVANADLIAYWNFNNQTAGSGGGPGTFNTTGSSEIYNATTEKISPASGGVKAAAAAVDFSGLAGAMGGTANNNWGTFAGDTSNTLNGDTAGGALAVIGSSNNNSSVIFTLSTQNVEDLVLTFATRGTSTGYNTQVWSYSTNGSTYTPFSTLTGRNVTSWSKQTVDFSSITALDNQATAYIKVTFSGATSTSGNNRVDNVQFNGTLVPEPATIGLLLSGLGLFLGNRRK